MLRQPILLRCPNCTTSIEATHHFCPQCQFQMSPVCGECHRGVKITDAFCTTCGHDLATDGAPARLRAYSD
jgi:predicted amidophosphoribosyltransferase